MSNAVFTVPKPINEPVKSYAPGSPERKELKAAIDHYYCSAPVEVKMVIDGKPTETADIREIRPPHKLDTLIGQYHYGNESHINQCIEASLNAQQSWAEMPWPQRAAIFLRAADLIAGPYRARINAATMIGQSKNAYQAEIDSACELIDFLRFNVAFAEELYQQQPVSSPGIWNRMEYRPLEGFVLAVTPFNFTAIGGNLPTAPALMGNVVVWKPSLKQLLSAQVIMEVLEKAGLPAGVINLLFAPGEKTVDVCSQHPDFAGIHFTGSTGVFQSIWKKIGDNISTFRTYPRIVGETGGKDFVMVHQSAVAEEVATALVRGAFEYQGQKCSAASRAYIPANLWDKVKELLLSDLKTIKLGPPEDFSNFVNAVIDENAFNKLAKYIDEAKESGDAEIIAGGNYDKSEGYFIEPTVILAKAPKYVTMCEELFGPVLTIYVYDTAKFEETLDLVNNTSIYALTGSIFAKDRKAVEMATKKLVNAAGNFYINDKPTGAVVGQQPFGGARGSGTNDKAGSILNLIRWVSARTLKETYVPATDYRYPFLKE
ncbi:MAG: L-glutamate gamma-semialdehyde dehydrogenase [Bacteroidia bacterium]